MSFAGRDGRRCEARWPAAWQRLLLCQLQLKRRPGVPRVYLTIQPRVRWPRHLLPHPHFWLMRPRLSQRLPRCPPEIPAPQRPQAKSLVRA